MKTTLYLNVYTTIIYHVTHVRHIMMSHDVVKIFFITLLINRDHMHKVHDHTNLSGSVAKQARKAPHLF